MRWTIQFGGDPQDVTVTTSGKATPEGFARMNAELVNDDRFGPEMLVLVDHTHLVVDELRSQDVRAISDDFVRHNDDLRSAFVALVVPTPLQFGLARMSTIMAEPPTPSIEVFDTQTEALGWLERHAQRRGMT